MERGRAARRSKVIAAVYYTRGRLQACDGCVKRWLNSGIISPRGGYVPGHGSPLRYRWGSGETGFPQTPARGRVREGCALPGRTYVRPVSVRRSRMNGCGDHRAPRAAPSQPPPAGGRRRVPAPGGGGSGRRPSPCPRRRGAGVPPALPGHGHRAGCAMRMTVSRDHTPSARGVGKAGFPTPPPARGPGPHAGVWGNRVSPDPPPGGRAQPSQEEPVFISSGCGSRRTGGWRANGASGGGPIWCEICGREPRPKAPGRKRRQHGWPRPRRC